MGGFLSIFRYRAVFQMLNVARNLIFKGACVGKDQCILAQNLHNCKIFIEYLSDKIRFLGVVGLLIGVGAKKTEHMLMSTA